MEIEDVLKASNDALRWEVNYNPEQLANLEARAQLAEEAVKALRAVLIMGDTVKPRKLNAALTWVENDALARKMADDVFARAEKLGVKP